MTTNNAKFLPNFNKLELGKDVFEWTNNIELHFRSLDIWDDFINGPSLSSEERNNNQKKIEARCKRDLLHSLSPQLQLSVRHLGNAKDMYDRIKKLFVGGIIAEKSKLINRIARIRLEGDFFTFMNDYHACVTQLISMGEDSGFKIVCMQFLNKLPRMLGAVTHPLKNNIESEYTEDNSELWLTVYDTVLDYLVDCGLFSAAKKHFNKINNGNKNAFKKGKSQSFKGGKSITC